MVGIVHRNSVQKDKVFVGISAPDADAAESLGRSLHAWKHLERLKHILLPEQDRRLKHRQAAQPYAPGGWHVHHLFPPVHHFCRVKQLHFRQRGHLFGRYFHC